MGKENLILEGILRDITAVGLWSIGFRELFDLSWRNPRSYGDFLELLLLNDGGSYSPEIDYDGDGVFGLLLGLESSLRLGKF